MSWFSDLAGKAETLLNKVDQGAATALSLSKHGSQTDLSYHSTGSEALGNYSETQMQQSNTSLQYQTYGKTGYIASVAGNIKQQKSTILAGTLNVKPASWTSSDTPPGPPGGVSTPRPSTQFVRRKKSEPDDELLFDFLNSSEKVSNGKADSKKEKIKEPIIESHSRSSSISSVSTSTPTIRTTEDDSTNIQSNAVPCPGTPDGTKAVHLDANREDASSSSASSHSHAANDDGKTHELSNLRLENQLLRNEVQSLNQEMAALLQRSKETQEELNKSRTRMEKWNTDYSKSDRVVRELRAQVDDMMEVISAKDAQLAVLKVRLQEADQLLSSRTEALETLHSEQSRILQDQTEGSSMHSQALQSMQERLRESESAVKREQESYKQMQNEFTTRLNKMEVERQTLVEALSTAEKKHAEEKRRGDELNQQVKIHKASVESAKQEMIDYKQKATRILQSKEKLINSLKEGSGIEGLDSHMSNAMELEEVRHERDAQREEIQKLMGQIQQLRAELQDMDSQQVTEAESTREQLQDLQEQLAGHRRSKQELEAELERQKQEFQYTEEELYRTKSTLQSRMKDREDEIQKLRNQLTNKALSSSSQTELENRLHQLTETLIQKQTMLESLSTEKNSLVYQLERLEQQLKSIQGSSANGPSINMTGVDNGEGTRMRNVPVLFGDSDTNVEGMYGRVRKAASTIDRFSIRLGIFLRRYPMARQFVVVYMAMLHIWVMIVLLTYTPEMHHDHPIGR
ncbi:golgin subfamily A member 5 isoform X2 [Ambystoma mexicanum]